jgi:hypothetical protein
VKIARNAGIELRPRFWSVSFILIVTLRLALIDEKMFGWLAASQKKIVFARLGAQAIFDHLKM